MVLDGLKDRSLDNKGQKIAENQKLCYLTAKIVQYLMALKAKAGITRKQKIADHQKSGYLSAKIVQYLMALKTKVGKQGRGR